MTSNDFVKSLIPFNEAYLHTRVSESSPVNVKDHSGTSKETNENLMEAYRDISSMADTNGDGLISYDEYMLFMIIISSIYLFLSEQFVICSATQFVWNSIQSVWQERERFVGIYRIRTFFGRQCDLFYS